MSQRYKVIISVAWAEDYQVITKKVPWLHHDEHDETSARDHSETKPEISAGGEIGQKTSARDVIQQKSIAPGEIQERTSARDEKKQVTSVHGELNDSMLIFEKVKVAIAERSVGVRQRASAENRQKDS